jgi:shikimate kinase
MSVGITVRRPWTNPAALFLVGPGGVGKSTLGAVLAPALGRAFIDLDSEFTARIGPIGDFIRGRGYPRYAAENSALAQALVQAATEPLVFVASSGFLASDASPDLLTANLALVRAGYAITLSPAEDIEAAAAIVVERQLGRGFGLEREREGRIFRTRFGAYWNLADMTVVASGPPGDTASAIAARLAQAQTVT